MGTPSPANPTGRAIHYFFEDPKTDDETETENDSAISTTASCGGTIVGEIDTISECSLVGDLYTGLYPPVATCDDADMCEVQVQAPCHPDGTDPNPNLYIGMFLPWEIEPQPNIEQLKVKKNRSKKDKKEGKKSKKFKKSKKSKKSRRSKSQVKDDEP